MQVDKNAKHPEIYCKNTFARNISFLAAIWPSSQDALRFCQLAQFMRKNDGVFLPSILPEEQNEDNSFSKYIHLVLCANIQKPKLKIGKIIQIGDRKNNFLLSHF